MVLGASDILFLKVAVPSAELAIKGEALYAVEMTWLSGSAAEWTAANCLTEVPTVGLDPRLPVEALRIGEGLNCVILTGLE